MESGTSVRVSSVNESEGRSDGGTLGGGVGDCSDLDPELKDANLEIEANLFEWLCCWRELLLSKAPLLESARLASFDGFLLNSPLSGLEDPPSKPH